MKLLTNRFFSEIKNAMKESGLKFLNKKTLETQLNLSDIELTLVM